MKEQKPMRNDIETVYQRSLPDFLRVLPEGFQVAGQVEPTLEVVIHDEQVVRKLWDHGNLACQSTDGFSSQATGKACRLCRDQSRCTPQIVLYVLVGQSPFRLALNYTSGNNYLAYRRRVKENGQELSAVVTLLTVVSRATWGEVQFQDLF